MTEDARKIRQKIAKYKAEHAENQTLYFRFKNRRQYLNTIIAKLEDELEYQTQTVFEFSEENIEYITEATL